MNDQKVWQLKALLEQSGIPIPANLPDLEIRQVTDDSRAVGPHSLFVAVAGSQSNGHRFLPQAVQQGARVLLVDEPVQGPSGVLVIRVASTRAILGSLIHTFWGSSTQKLKMIGVTGTNGKTTVAWLTQHLLSSAGISCGLIGTINNRIGDLESPSQNTTPGVVLLQETLHQMVEASLQACAMEVSSHALDQQRTSGVEWTTAIFTNLSPEHLDYHLTMEDYLGAKLRLFEALPACARAILNQDEPASNRVRQVTQAPIWTFATRSLADWTAQILESSLEGMRLNLETPQGKFSVSFPWMGRHNVENLLAAVAAAASIGVDVRAMIPALESFPGVPGRLERVQEGQAFPVLVDYAHTDGALRQVLETLRSVTSRRIGLVFGCGGNRDQTKRPRMGQVAGELADRVIVTSDNPRQEDPAEIAQAVAQGLEGSSTPWEIILDRRQAIQTALADANENWVVLVAGKGHENHQIVGKEKFPFDDRQVIRELLRSREQIFR